MGAAYVFSWWAGPGRRWGIDFAPPPFSAADRGDWLNWNALRSLPLLKRSAANAFTTEWAICAVCRKNYRKRRYQRFHVCRACLMQHSAKRGGHVA